MAAQKIKNIIVGYGRKSKEDKGKNNLSISTQKELCKKYAEDKGCKFIYFSYVNKTGDVLTIIRFIIKNAILMKISLMKLCRKF